MLTHLEAHGSGPHGAIPIRAPMERTTGAHGNEATRTHLRHAHPTPPMGARSPISAPGNGATRSCPRHAVWPRNDRDTLSLPTPRNNGDQPPHPYTHACLVSLGLGAHAPRVSKAHKACVEPSNDRGHPRAQGACLVSLGNHAPMPCEPLGAHVRAYSVRGCATSCRATRP